MEEDGQYKLMVYEKALEEGTIQTLVTVSSLPILERLGETHMGSMPWSEGLFDLQGQYWL